MQKYPKPANEWFYMLSIYDIIRKENYVEVESSVLVLSVLYIKVCGYLKEKISKYQWPSKYYRKETPLTIIK